MIKKNKKMIAIYSAIIFFMALDRFLKVFALNRGEQGYNLIGEFLKFKFKANYYIAFSLPLSGDFLVAAIILILIGLMTWAAFFLRRDEKKFYIPLILIIAGAGGNLFDRVKYGYVADYLDLKYFTVFNLADAMIVAGVLWLIIVSYKKEAK